MGTIAQNADVNATWGNQRFNNAGNATDTNLWVTNVVGVPPAGHQGTTYRGRTCWKLTTNTGNGYTFFPNTAASRAVQMPIALQKTVGGNPGLMDDYYCFEFSYILAWDVFAGNISPTGDTGITVAVGTRAAIRNGNQAGVEFGPINANTGQLGVYIQQTDGAGPTQQTTVSPTNFDYTKWNKLAIRFVGPTQSAEAAVRLLVNDQVQLTVNYGAGTVLPDQLLGTGLAFEPTIPHFATQGATTTVMYLSSRGGIVSYAPTEALLT